jgi:hypothetical protein
MTIIQQSGRSIEVPDRDQKLRSITSLQRGNGLYHCLRLEMIEQSPSNTFTSAMELPEGAWGTVGEEGKENSIVGEPLVKIRLKLFLLL